MRLLAKSQYSHRLRPHFTRQPAHILAFHRSKAPLPAGGASAAARRQQSAGLGQRGWVRTCGVKLLHRALPHHSALVQENDAVHCRGQQGGVEGGGMGEAAG